jgi:O-antigen ligase
MEARLQRVISSWLSPVLVTDRLKIFSYTMRSSSDVARPAGLPSPEPRPANWWGNLAMAGLPVLACFLGGATEKWSEGIVIALLGLFLLGAPPRFSLGAWTNGILLALALCATVAFLPARWFFEPAWRTALINDFAIRLPSTLSPQPWLTLGCLISFLAGLSWLYCVTAEDLELRAVRLQLRLFAGGIVFLGVLCLALYYARATLPFWYNQRGFGPFPNRNQTGDLLALSAIVIIACAQDAIRQGKMRWIAWLLGLGVMIAAVIVSSSRAGLVILVVGSGLWIGWYLLRKGSAARIALGVCILLGVLAILLFVGGQTLERFHLRGAQANGDFRWVIFQDAFRLIQASPWCGIGLGNFEPVFAIFREPSFGTSRVLHPESDWIWLWVELGWPGLLLAIAGAILFLRRVFPLQEGSNQRFRVAALIGAMMFALHGLIDVSGHRIGTAFAGIFLVGMALRRPLDLYPSRLTPVVFRMLGVLFLVCGIAWLAATRYEMLLPGGIGVENARQSALRAKRGQNFVETVALTDRALKWAPLDWHLYFLRAVGKTGRKWPADAVDDFRRARYLEPNAVDLPFQEGLVWMPTRPILAVTAWREALRRAGPQRAELYGRMLRSAREYPAVIRGLERVSPGQPDLVLVFLESTQGEAFDDAVQRFIISDPDLKALSPGERKKLFSLWADRGNLETLEQMVAKHPEWVPFAWEGLAKLHARRNDFRAACELAQKFETPPPLPQISALVPIEQLQTDFHSHPNDYSAGLALYQEQMRQGKIDDALGTVRHFTAIEGSPSYFFFLEAQSWAANENWERAWKSWQSFQTARKKERDDRR